MTKEIAVTEKLYALHDLDAGRFYVGVGENAHAHAPDAEVVLEVETEDAALALAYVRDGLASWHQGGGWFHGRGTVEVATALFNTVRTFPHLLSTWVDLALEVEVKADAPPAMLLEEVEAGEAPEPDASEARAERRRQALEAGLIRGG